MVRQAHHERTTQVTLENEKNLWASVSLPDPRRAAIILSTQPSGKYAMVARTTDTIHRPRYTDHHEDPGMYGLLGERVPIEVIQHPTIEYVTMAVRYILRGEGAVFLGSNIPLRTNRLNRREHEAPDYYLARNVNVAAIRGETAYNLWEVGKPPEWALGGGVAEYVRERPVREACQVRRDRDRRVLDVRPYWRETCTDRL